MQFSPPALLTSSICECISSNPSVSRQPLRRTSLYWAATFPESPESLPRVKRT